MILHLSQILRTEALTFILFTPIHNSPPRQIVGGKFHFHFVSRQNPNKMHPHLPGHVGPHLMPILQLNAKEGVRVSFNNSPVSFD